MSQVIRFGGIFHQQDSDDTADLGVDVVADELVIPVTHAYVSKVTGADAEALTLANGKPSQILFINITEAGGGAATLTPANASNWATVVFQDVGDQAILWYPNDDGGWLLVSLLGTAGPPAMTV